MRRRARSDRRDGACRRVRMNRCGPRGGIRGQRESDGRCGRRRVRERRRTRAPLRCWSGARAAERYEWTLPYPGIHHEQFFPALGRSRCFAGRTATALHAFGAALACVAPNATPWVTSAGSLSVGLDAVNPPIVASPLAAQDVSQGVGQLSQTHGGTRASGSTLQRADHGAVQKVSVLIHAGVSARAAVARKRPPGKAEKILSGFSLSRAGVRAAVPREFGAHVPLRKVFQLRNAAAPAHRFPCAIRGSPPVRSEIARRRDLHRSAFFSNNGSATASCEQARRPNESIKNIDAFKENA